LPGIRGKQEEGSTRAIYEKHEPSVCVAATRAPGMPQARGLTFGAGFLAMVFFTAGAFLTAGALAAAMASSASEGSNIDFGFGALFVRLLIDEATGFFAGVAFLAALAGDFFGGIVVFDTGGGPKFAVVKFEGSNGLFWILPVGGTPSSVGQKT
jgi:hypothetical protein